jgi:hypothetical protein
MMTHDSRLEIKIKYDREDHTVHVTPETLAVKSGTTVRWTSEGASAQIVLPGHTPVTLLVEPGHPVSVLAGAPVTVNYGVVVFDTAVFEAALRSPQQSTRATGMAVLIIYP